MEGIFYHPIRCIFYKSQNSPKTFYKLKETRSNLRKKPSVYLYVHAKEYTQNTICSVKLHKKKKRIYTRKTKLRFSSVLRIKCTSGFYGCSHIFLFGTVLFHQKALAINSGSIISDISICFNQKII